MKEIEIKEIGTKNPEYEALLQFRNKLLRQPLGLNLFDEDLSQEVHDRIIVAMQSGKIIGCVMLKPEDNERIKLRQMATAEDMQGKGLGSILLTTAEATALENGYKQIVLHARISAKGFYEKLGYTPFGEVFTEVTLPHIAMKKTLR